ncbi:5-oxoprolinase subunit PxpA [Ferrimonas gelatinilytica]|uniref:5-oxoprolinase subunit PxpA n=1 Tax=Ferrimonas gelatinilytica TaxID=1255257 RepID=A0ABP9S0M2_9GAMM
MRSLDINCDLGEGAGQDDRLMPLISSANIACGGHAGDRASMLTTLLLARKHGVAIGAHPGYDDREQFGRRPLSLSKPQLKALMREQIQALASLAHPLGSKLHHVKLHGALYNQASHDRAMANVVVETLQSLDPGLKLYALANSPLQSMAQQAGLTVIAEGFADRRYRNDGTLVPRSEPNASISSLAACLRQLQEMVEQHRVTSVEGEAVPLRIDTLCVHGDGPHALPFARAIRQWMAQHRVTLSTPGDGALS